MFGVATTTALSAIISDMTESQQKHMRHWGSKVERTRMIHKDHLLQKHFLFLEKMLFVWVSFELELPMCLFQALPII